MYLQINTVKYNADWEIMSIYENLQTVWSQFSLIYLFIFGQLRISIGLLVFGFIANEYQRRAIRLLLTIHIIQSAIRWAILKVILNHSCLLSYMQYVRDFGLGFFTYRSRVFCTADALELNRWPLSCKHWDSLTDTRSSSKLGISQSTTRKNT